MNLHWDGESPVPNIKIKVVVNMKSMRGTVDGMIVAEYRKGKFTWTCKTSGNFYCATFHNGRQSATTYYSTDKNEINELLRKEIKDGFKKV
ncbi:MAG: hypothetical protein SPF36_07785 [Lachnospiraceae bacterium]|nr:hypothetical protein [Lachnospiraceae bacterium]